LDLRADRHMIPRMSDRAINTCGFCAAALTFAALLMIWHL
jgi:hypothetical protein